MTHRFLGNEVRRGGQAQDSSDRAKNEKDVRPWDPPEVCWTRRLCDKFKDHSEFQVSAKDALRLMGLGYRLKKYIDTETSKGRLPIMNPFYKNAPGPRMGVPVGGIGSGSIGRGWCGDFGRWQLFPGFPNYNIVEADQFSVFIGDDNKLHQKLRAQYSAAEHTTYVKERKTPGKSRVGEKGLNSSTSGGGGAGGGKATVLFPGKPKQNKLGLAWNWGLQGTQSFYHAVYPRAWTVYNEPDPNIKLTCRQFSPVIPGNYKETSFPVGVFVWDIENNYSESEREVSLMFTFQNGTGDDNDTKGGHFNLMFTPKEEEMEGLKGQCVGIEMHHRAPSHARVLKIEKSKKKKKKKGGEDDEDEDMAAYATNATTSAAPQKTTDKVVGAFGLTSDPLTLGIAVHSEDNSAVLSYCTRFSSSDFKDCDNLWKTFSRDGVLGNANDLSPSQPGETIGSALSCKVKVPPGGRKRLVFSLAWDQPIVRFNSGKGYYKRYTKWYGTNGQSVEHLLVDSLKQWEKWEKEISDWQDNILKDPDLPSWYKHALFNELYYLVEGGSSWTTGESSGANKEEKGGGEEEENEGEEEEKVGEGAMAEYTFGEGEKGSPSEGKKARRIYQEGVASFGTCLSNGLTLPFTREKFKSSPHSFPLPAPSPSPSSSSRTPSSSSSPSPSPSPSPSSSFSSATSFAGSPSPSPSPFRTSYPSSDRSPRRSPSPFSSRSSSPSSSRPASPRPSSPSTSPPSPSALPPSPSQTKRGEPVYKFSPPVSQSEAVEKVIPPPPPQQDETTYENVGRFQYLESLEYLMVNTYDVHFYASWALAMLWPLLELTIQKDFAAFTLVEYPDKWMTLHSSKEAMRKVAGAVPHDLGNPGDDPWYKVNSYNIQPINAWKDLNCKFVLQVYRDYYLTGNRKFLWDCFSTCRVAIEYVARFDTDADGLIENQGFPDQTYDTWSANGASAYSGGLWLTALAAMGAMCRVLGKEDEAAQYETVWQRGKQNYHAKLWNPRGGYFNYDTSDNIQHDSIMTDAMCGQWWARACELPSIADDSCVASTLKNIHRFNVMGFKNGQLGPMNGMRPDGKLDVTCLQSVEVWTGTAYGAGACMLQEGLVQQGFDTIRGIIRTTYETVGYMFQTPEAWDAEGHYRALGYMRPLSIWGMQYAWEKFAKCKRNQPDSTSTDYTVNRSNFFYFCCFFLFFLLPKHFSHPPSSSSQRVDASHWKVHKSSPLVVRRKKSVKGERGILGSRTTGPESRRGDEISASSNSPLLTLSAAPLNFPPVDGGGPDFPSSPSSPSSSSPSSSPSSPLLEHSPPSSPSKLSSSTPSTPALSLPPSALSKSASPSLSPSPRSGEQEQGGLHDVKDWLQNEIRLPIVMVQEYVSLLSGDKCGVASMDDVKFLDTDMLAEIGIRPIHRKKILAWIAANP